MLVRRKCVDRMYDHVKFRCFPLLEESEPRPRKPQRFALQFEQQNKWIRVHDVPVSVLQVVGFGRAPAPAGFVQELGA